MHKEIVWISFIIFEECKADVKANHGVGISFHILFSRALVIFFAVFFFKSENNPFSFYFKNFSFKRYVYILQEEVAIAMGAFFLTSTSNSFFISLIPWQFLSTKMF